MEAIKDMVDAKDWDGLYNLHQAPFWDLPSLGYDILKRENAGNNTVSTM